MNQVLYKFDIENGENYQFTVDLERRPSVDEDLPSWTELDNCQCRNCPLNGSHCPAAVDIYRVAESFTGILSIRRAVVTVQAGGRCIQKECAVQEGIRSLLGLIMASSACPVLSRMRPLALQHLPFSDMNEMVVRLASSYLLSQYLKEGDDKDWEMSGLMELFKDLSVVNHDFMERVREVSEKDSVLNAVYSLAAFSQIAELGLDNLLGSLRGSYAEAF